MGGALGLLEGDGGGVDLLPERGALVALALARAADAAVVAHVERVAAVDHRVAAMPCRHRRQDLGVQAGARRRLSQNSRTSLAHLNQVCSNPVLLSILKDFT